MPAASDPEGKDLVDGAVVAALENSGGYRLYKIIHVEYMPAPLGQELHMIAYDPKGNTFEDAARIWARHEAKVLSAHIIVNKGNFMTRDHRVLATEKVTDEERAPYARSLR